MNTIRKLVSTILPLLLFNILVVNAEELLDKEMSKTQIACNFKFNSAKEYYDKGIAFAKLGKYQEAIKILI